MKHLTKPHILLPSSLLIIDMAVFCLTDPKKVPSFMLIVGFLLLVATIYYLVRGFTRASRWYGLKLTHPKRFSLIVTAVIGGVMALQSMGELTGHDILVLLPFLGLSYLYFSYGRAGRELSAN